MVVDNIENLAKELHRFIVGKKGVVIGIDGCDGAGKTTLGEEISKLLKIESIDLDTYIIGKNGDFLNSINDQKLRIDVELLRERNLIISGICLLQILERNCVKLDKLIYVKRYNSGGIFWLDEDDCIIEGDPCEILVDRVKKYKKIITGEEREINPKDYQFEIDKIVYHQKYRPHENADIVFIRKEYY